MSAHSVFLDAIERAVRTLPCVRNVHHVGARRIVVRTYARAPPPNESTHILLTSERQLRLTRYTRQIAFGAFENHTILAEFAFAAGQHIVDALCNIHRYNRLTDRALRSRYNHLTDCALYMERINVILTAAGSVSVDAVYHAVYFSPIDGLRYDSIPDTLDYTVSDACVVPLLAAAVDDDVDMLPLENLHI